VSSTPFIERRSVSSENGQTTGVHSLERSAQEDTLLVLFNTAISNLVRYPRRCVVVTAQLTLRGGSVP
jgi:hypothetical protein